MIERIFAAIIVLLVPIALGVLLDRQERERRAFAVRSKADHHELCGRVDDLTRGLRVLARRLALKAHPAPRPRPRAEIPFDARVTIQQAVPAMPPEDLDDDGDEEGATQTYSRPTLASPTPAPCSERRA
jgi:hypothetical protein